MSRKLMQAPCAGFPCKLPEARQDWHSEEHGPSRVLAISEPANVMFNPLADPVGPNSIDGRRSNEIAVKHDNLLSKNNQERSSRLWV
jgi:hypothetical protein